MRNLIIGVAAALLAMAAPAVASAQTSGGVRMTYASIDDDADSGKDSVVAFSGAVLTEINSNWRVQFNGTAADLEHFTHSDSFAQVEIHGIYDFGNNVSVGVFTGQNHFIGESFWLYGAEVSYTMSRGEVSASISAADDVNGANDDLSNVGVQGAFYVTENLSVGASGSWTDLGGVNDDVESYGVNVGYHIPNTGFMIGAGYRSTDHFGGDTEAFGITLGWGFGDESRGRWMPGAAGLLGDEIAAF